MKIQTLTNIAASMAVVLSATTIVPFSYAAESSAEAEVTVTVQSSLGISVNTTESSIQIPINSYNNGTVAGDRIQHKISVNSNGAYRVTIEDADNVTSLENGGNTIPSVLTNGTTLTAGTSGWGWQNIDSESAGHTNSWNPIPENNSGTTIKTSASSTSGIESFYIRFGVATSDSLEAGDYKDTIIYRIIAD